MNLEALSRYFDHAATTPMDPQVLEAMKPHLTGGFGNPNSIHSAGRKAREAVERARTQVAQLIGAEDPAQIYFTSGATEANNWVAASTRNGVTSPFEHPSLLLPARAHDWKLFTAVGVEVTPNNESVDLASLMSVNNETGTCWDLRSINPSAQKLHTDATQAVGKLHFSASGFDYVSMSAHKLYGPKGVGALYCQSTPPEPLLLGGEQELGFRSGTLNVAGIVGFGAAAVLAADNLERELEHAQFLRQGFLGELTCLEGWKVLGGARTSPFILCVSFAEVEGETLVVEADRAGFCISSGAACSSSSTEPSHVLTAMGCDEATLRGTVRISFGKFNTVESALSLAQTLAHSVKNLRTMSIGHANPRNGG